MRTFSDRRQPKSKPYQGVATNVTVSPTGSRDRLSHRPPEENWLRGQEVAGRPSPKTPIARSPASLNAQSPNRPSPRLLDLSHQFHLLREIHNLAHTTPRPEIGRAPSPRRSPISFFCMV